MISVVGSYNFLMKGQATTDEVHSGGSYLSQNDLRLHFGLGQMKTVDTVEVDWPSGAVERLTNLQADRFYLITEGQGLVSNTMERAKHQARDVIFVAEVSIATTPTEFQSKST
jgi:hypothetical protein